MPDERDSERPGILDRWLVRFALAVIVVLQFALVNDLGYGSRRMAPIVELVLLLPGAALSLRAEVIAARARDSGKWERATSYRGLNLVIGVTLLVIVSLANARALWLLLDALLAGKTHNGRTLLLDALNIWATNVIVFSLWYWVLDRGGPWIDGRDHRGPSEFVFPQMMLPAETVRDYVRPRYVDYLFLSFNTSTAFSPTDTAPLTARMKLLMMLEAIVSLGTLALVAARAVNILA
jgi:uncharacterized membrane protein